MGIALTALSELPVEEVRGGGEGGFIPVCPFGVVEEEICHPPVTYGTDRITKRYVMHQGGVLVGVSTAGEGA